jgi:class 3 adenylate cyclase
MNVAARLEQMALPGSILISADRKRMAKGYLAVTALGPSSVEGLNTPLETSMNWSALFISPAAEGAPP